MTSLTYRQILQTEMQTKKLRNPSYNLSSFAKLLDIPSSRMSEILRGKVGLSIAKAAKICSALNFDERATSLFLDLVRSDHARSPKEKKEAKKRVELHKNFIQYHQDQFNFIADWYHHAIIELIGLDNSKSALAIGKCLALDTKTTNQAIARLVKMDIIVKEKKGFSISSSNRRTTIDIPSDAIKKLNKQMLNKASNAIDQQTVDNRDFSIIFFSFNKSQLKMAKEKMRSFRREFMEEFESAAGKDSIYTMGMQLFELTNTNKNK